MFKLEKVFQNDDSGYIFYVSGFKSVSIFVFLYFFSILYENTIYELINFEVFTNSNIFIYSLLVPTMVFFLIFF